MGSRLPGAFTFMRFNHYRIIVVTSARMVVLDAGQASMKTARGVVTELPRYPRLGPAAGIWHAIPAGSETIRVHRRFFTDIDTADIAVVMA